MSGRKKKMLILGDSLGLPREVPGQQDNYILRPDETYPYVLGRLLPEWEIISALRASNRTDKQARTASLERDILSQKPEVVVVQLGIVDCAPRLFGLYESFLLGHMPGSIRKPIIAFFSRHRYFFTKHLRKVYVKQSVFKMSIAKIMGAIARVGASAIVVGIADTNERNHARTYGYSENMRQYNKILRCAAEEWGATFIDTHNCGSKILLPDGIHLNVEGSRWLASEIAGIVRKNTALGTLSARRAVHSETMR